MNTIILKKGELRLTEKEFKKFQKGDSIWGYDEFPEELKRWNISEKESARKELDSLRCSYKKSGCLFFIKEYALEYCKTDEEIISGSDFDIAAEEEMEE